MKRLVIAASLLAYSLPALALFDGLIERVKDEAIPGFFTGNKLYEEYTKNRALFIGYVTGVHDDAKVRMTFCSPAQATTVQISDVVMHYLRDNPTHRDQPAHWLVRDAFAVAWPCPKPPTAK